MGRSRIRRLVLIAPLLLAAWLAAGDSFAAAGPPVVLSVKVDKAPRTKTSSDEYKIELGTGGYADTGVSFGSETEKSQYFTTNAYRLNITVSNRGGQAGTFRLEWYFIAERIRGDGAKGYKKELEVAGRGQKNITLGAGAGAEETATHDFASKETYTVGTYAIALDPATGKLPDWAPASGIDEWDYESRNCERYAGYVVLITANGQVIAKDSNSSIFLKDKWIEKCRNTPKKKWQAPAPEWTDLYKKWF